MGSRAVSSIVFAAIAGLAACGDQQEGGSAGGLLEPDDSPPALVAASAETPPIAAPATHLALWAHPRMPFLSLAIAAHRGQALVAYSMEGELIDGYEGRFGQALDAHYTAAGDSLIATVDVETGLLAAFDIELEERLLRRLEIRGAEGDIPSPSSLCLTTRSSGALQLFAITSSVTVTQYNVSLADGAVALTEARRFPTPKRASACAGDGAADRLLLAIDETVYAVSADPATDAVLEPIVNTGAPIVSLAVAHNADGGYLMAHTAEMGALSVFELASGAPVGRFTVDDASDIDSVEIITALAASGGNYGAVFRNGIAIIADGSDDTDGANIKLAPLSGVLNGLGAPIGASIGRRDLLPAEPVEEEASSFDFSTPVDLN